jgi:hypothetical protein
VPTQSYQLYEKLQERDISTDTNYRSSIIKSDEVDLIMIAGHHALVIVPHLTLQTYPLKILEFFCLFNCSISLWSKVTVSLRWQFSKPNEKCLVASTVQEAMAKLGEIFRENVGFKPMHGNG